MYKKLKQKIYSLIREDDKNNIYGNVFDGLIISLIIINIVLAVADTFSLPQWYFPIADVIECVSIIVFSVEYLLRLFTADLKYSEKGCIASRLKYIFSFMAIIDLLAILPFYLPFIFKIDLRILRALRIFRLFRLFKFGRYTTAIRVIGDVLKRKYHQLISSMIVIFILMIIASILMYNVENRAQPEVFANAFSGLWWAVATFTTVGYGDIFPITVAGKAFAAIMALLGIGLVAVPTGIISAGFIELTEEKDPGEEKKYCPYCGHEYEK